MCGIGAGVVAPAPELSFVSKTPVMASLDAKNTFGFVAGSLAIDCCIDMASTYGIGMVSVEHSNHFGMGATYVLRAVKQGYASFAFTNASRAMPPWGGAEALLGTSPFAVGVPGGSEGDFILDMSPCVAAWGKMRKAARRGEAIPEGYALDCDGKPTTDPVKALSGWGSCPPRSGLAMIYDDGHVCRRDERLGVCWRRQYKNMDEAQNVGHRFLVFRPEVFLDGDAEEFRQRMDVLLRKVKGVRRAKGCDRIYVSGELEVEAEARREGGIPLSQGEIDSLHELAQKSGVEARLQPKK
ncbi:L-sulfolactate dehydrogenase [Tolypocladium ophioglossoides CBS 100239]|uniref:L-sulfolactate dehydrogenase n=1 Tax=Tolypocladium ophioglossoides (strain CBS 100239) TaxID=1163406 RepID=A0A0L0NCE2_TOLOC|nr:L-sulfolactate dehydrogenase [Tolypocladium ophioglossoides CBS 100239]